jgi:hypothetical protein
MPDAMLALVATAVRVTYQLRHYTNMKYQLYAAIREWRTGIHQPTDFSTDTYMDVYDGHVNTLEHLCDEHPRAYHVMMGELYDLARCVSWMRYHDHSCEIIAVHRLESPQHVQLHHLILVNLMIDQITLVFNKPSSNMVFCMSHFLTLYDSLIRAQSTTRPVYLIFQDIESSLLFSYFVMDSGTQTSAIGQWSCTT